MSCLVRMQDVAAHQSVSVDVVCVQVFNLDTVRFVLIPMSRLLSAHQAGHIVCD